MNRSLFVVMLALSITATAHSQACAGVHMPATTVVDGTTLLLNGLGLREATVFDVDVFVAALYVEHKSTSAKALLNTDERKQVVLHFVRATSASDIESELEDGFEANAPKASPALKKRLYAWLEDLEVGESITFTYVPGRGLQIGIKGRVKGTIASTPFAQATLSLLIGPHPPNEGLRTGLLGGKCG